MELQKIFSDFLEKENLKVDEYLKDNIPEILFIKVPHTKYLVQQLQLLLTSIMTAKNKPKMPRS